MADAQPSTVESLLQWVLGGNIPGLPDDDAKRQEAAQSALSTMGMSAKAPVKKDELNGLLHMGPPQKDTTVDIPAGSDENVIYGQVPAQGVGPGGIPLAPQYLTDPTSASPMAPSTVGPGGIPMAPQYTSPKGPQTVTDILASQQMPGQPDQPPDVPVEPIKESPYASSLEPDTIPKDIPPSEEVQHSLKPVPLLEFPAEHSIDPTPSDKPSSPVGMTGASNPPPPVETPQPLSANPDIDQIIKQAMGFVKEDTGLQGWDLSPFIAWTDSISGHNVLKGYQRPDTLSAKDAAKMKVDLAKKLADLYEKQAVDKKRSKYQAEAIRVRDEANRINEKNGGVKGFWTAMAAEDKARNAADQKSNDSKAIDEQIAQYKADHPDDPKSWPTRIGTSIHWPKTPGPGRSSAEKTPKMSDKEIDTYAGAAFTANSGRIYDPRAKPPRGDPDFKYKQDLASRRFAQYKFDILKLRDAEIAAGRDPRPAVQNYINSVNKRPNPEDRGPTGALKH